MGHQVPVLPRGNVSKAILAMVAMASILSLGSCGNPASPLPAANSGGAVTSAPTGTTSTGLAFGCAYSSVLSTDIICVSVSSTVASVPADGISTATITATVTKNGSPVTNNVVNFVLGDPTYGTLSQTTALSSAAGVATTTFKAGTTPGAVQINANFDTAGSYVAIGLTSTSTTTALSPGCNYSSAVATDIICVSAAASTTTLTADGTSKATITATVTKNGTALPGAVVSFSLGSNQYGILSAATGLTGATGTATTDFQAGTTLGAVQISVLYDTASTTTAIGLIGAPSTSAAGGIQFVSANPAAIGVQGSGLTTTSSITFKVTDSVGAAIAGATVNFTMIGPAGGTYIGATPGATTATGITDTSGNVSVKLNSGNLAGSATINASVTQGGLTFSASSSVLSIGGAVPSGSHFSLATERHNLPGLVLDGFTNKLTVFLADRFSNSAVLQGTQVSFYTEAGAVNPSAALDATGFGTVSFRTQNPWPVNSTVAPQPQTDGWVTVIAVVRGEESFVDANGNGVYDAGEPFTDLGEPFVDANNDGIWNVGEFFVDTNGNGVYNGPNGKWDGPNCSVAPANQAGCNSSPYIWVKNTLMFTGSIVNCTITASNLAVNGDFVVAAGGQTTFTISIGDVNFNHPVPGTVVKVTSNVGTLNGKTDFTVVDAVSSGPWTQTFRLASGSTPALPTPKAGSVTVDIIPPNGEGVAACPLTMYGVVN